MIRVLMLWLAVRCSFSHSFRLHNRFLRRSSTLSKEETNFSVRFLQNTSLLGHFSKRISHDYGVDRSRSHKREPKHSWVRFDLLKHFVKLNGNVPVVESFVVPRGSEWPASSHGFELGKHVARIRMKPKIDVHANDILRLNEMEFIWKVNEYKDNRILLALIHYKSTYNSTEVPVEFEIPFNDSKWPRITWGMRIGQILSSLRSKKYHPKILQEIELLGFVIEPLNSVSTICQILSALAAYKSVHGHVRVPQSFVVPENDSAYPEICWGLKLGTIVNHIRNEGSYAEHKNKLESLGVDFKVNKHPNFDVIYSALVAYKSVNGHVKVPQKFMVPENDSVYPESSWGLKLGIIVKSIKNKGTYTERREKLKLLGVDFEVKYQVGFDVIFACLEAYKFVHGHVKVPARFVVPHGDSNYFESSWGMKLGNILSSIRNKGYYAEHREKLEALGVDL